MSENQENNATGHEASASINDYQFHIDVVSPELISGWAVNKSDSTLCPKIEVFSGSDLLWQTEARNPREDLHEAGFGDAAFVLVPTVIGLQSDINDVDIYIDGYKANEQAFPLELNALNPEDYVCHIDAADDNAVLGWARYIHDDSRRVTVELRCEGNTLASGVAENFRDDLQQAGIGDGYHGFNLAVNLANFPAEVATCKVYVDGLLSSQEPVTLTSSAEAIAQAKFVAAFADQIGSFENKLKAETQRIAKQVADATPENEPASLNIVTNIAINNIAELSARVALIESILTKHLAK